MPDMSATSWEEKAGAAAVVGGVLAAIGVGLRAAFRTGALVERLDLIARLQAETNQSLERIRVEIREDTGRLWQEINAERLVRAELAERVARLEGEKGG